MKLHLLLLFVATVHGIDVARFLTNTGHGAAVRFGINSSTNASTVGSNGSIISSRIRNYPLDLTASEPLSSARTESMDDTSNEVRKELREHLDELLEKIKDAIDHGKAVKEKYLEKFKELKQKLKDMKEDIGEKAKELIEKLKEKGKDYLKKILERLGLD